jgi:very-short-patch-repair endonuclease
MSDAEMRLWYHLRAHRFCGASFRRQTLIGPFVVDFVCHDARLVIEVDGGQHARTIEMELDTQRSSWLTRHGYKVLRFWNNDVLSNTAGVLESIATELRKAPPSLLAAKRPRADLPLKGGGEERVSR